MAIRNTTLILKNSDIVNRPLPNSLLAGEPIVNTADGIVYFSGVTTSTSEWTPAGTGATELTYFEVGSNLYDLRLRNRITEYESVSGSGLIGKFLSGTTNGFVLADISSIVSTGVTDTYWTSGSTGTSSLKAINASGLDSTGNRSVSINNNTLASGNDSFASGISTIASGIGSHAEGSGTTASGKYSHSEGYGTTASGDYSHAEGQSTVAFNYWSHSEGDSTSALGTTSHSEGSYTTANGAYSHSEGESTIAFGNRSHSEGQYTIASGDTSHAEGYYTTAFGNYSHSQGYYTNAISLYSHAGGYFTTASGTTSFIHSTNSSVLANRSVVLGGQNITGTTNDTVYVPYLNLNYLPTLNNSNTELLSRNSLTGDVEYTPLSAITSTDTYVTGYTYTPNSNTFTIKQNQGQPDLTATFNSVSGLTVNGDLTITGNTSVQSLTANTFNITSTPVLNNSNTQFLSRNTSSGAIEYTPLSAITSNDTFVTGYTYTPSSNTFTIKQNQGKSDISVSFNSMSGLTVNGNLTVTGNTSMQSLTGTSALFSGSGTNVLSVVGSGGTIFSVSGTSGEIFSVHDNNTGPIFAVSTINNNPIMEIYSGGNSSFYGTVTVTGNTTLLSGLTANTLNISSTPVLNNSNTQFLTRNSSTGTVEYTPLSAITSLDTFVTGYTYSPGSNTFTIKQNQGQSDLTASFTEVSGLTVNNDLNVMGNLTVFGTAISAFTSQLYVEDPNVIFNYNPTGSTTLTSINAGMTIQDGNGVSGGSVNFDIVRMQNLTGLTPTQIPDVSEYTGTTGYENRGWITQLNDIIIRSTDPTDGGSPGDITGVRVLTEFDVLDGGTF